MSLSDIRTEMAAVLALIPGLYASAFYPDLITTPVAIVGGPDIVFDDDTMSDVYDFPVTLLVSNATDRRAQVMLDSFCASSGATSVRAALEVAVPTSVQTWVVTRIIEYGTHSIQNTNYLGATLIVRAVAYRQ